MFQKAVPVFAEGKENEMNYQLILRASADSLEGTTLSISAATFYRLWVNGRFVAFGPGRAAEGYARVDQLPLEEYHRSGKINEIVIEVAGYCCKSTSTVYRTSFVCAELLRGEEVLLATGRDFEGYHSCRRMQKVERYSAQRHFGEIWNYHDADPFSETYRVRLTKTSSCPSYLPRRAPYPSYEEIKTEGFVSGGRFRYDENKPCQLNRYSGTHMGPQWGQFYKGDTVSLPYRWLQKQQLIQTVGRGSFPIQISAGEYVMLDLNRIYAGFLQLGVTVQEDCDAVLGFSELCSPNRFEFTNINCQNVIEYFLPEGETISLESFEPYTCRLAILMVRKGSLLLNSFGVRTFEYDRSRMIRREIRDPDLRKIYEAAERTFAHNAVDMYTDCPSRERVGWLCDSYFTGQSEYFLTGKSAVEEAFLENYRLFKNDGTLPEGVLPMCYPADRYDCKKFIPQWDMWYVLEVRDYLTLRNPSADREAFRKSVYGVLRFLERFENQDGLLQNVDGWNFVEWSSANDWVKDVNYPTNFLYAEMLRAIAQLYGENELAERAERVAKKAAELSFDGEVFIDHAVVGEDGLLHNTRNSSEAGQYYALLFGNIDLREAKYAKLKEYVGNNFSTFQTEGRGFVPVNAFIGMYLRISALMKLGEKETLRQDLKAFFGGMVESTGTLWEYKQFKGSFDHGFASFAALAVSFVEAD
ncbi:MAG: hypothetical protein IKA44_04520 [Clostridia bacterium]|nr:hypothetical protein [Clostridia bacterium]